MITSKNNSKIKLFRSLRSRKGRQAAGLCLVEGIRPVGEAVQSGTGIEAIVYCDEMLHSDFGRMVIDEGVEKGVTCLEVSREVFLSLADKDNPQGLLAVTRQVFSEVQQLNPENFPWGVAIVSPQDPGNIGTILRTVDAVGASGLILLDESVEPYHPSSVRASMGSIFWQPVALSTFTDFIIWQNQYGYALIGSSAHSGVEYTQMDSIKQPCILLLGSEREGLSDTQTADCDQMIRLPMRGRGTSLNLAVAAGILLYAMLEKII